MIVTGQRCGLFRYTLMQGRKETRLQIPIIDFEYDDLVLTTQEKCALPRSREELLMLSLNEVYTYQIKKRENP